MKKWALRISVLFLLLVMVLPVSVGAAETVEWEVGTIASADGQNNASTTRLRTTDYLLLSDYSGVSINSGYTMTNFVYDENMAYLGTSSWLGSGVSFETADLTEKYPTGMYFRVVLRALDQKTLTVDNISDTGVTFYGPGEEIPVLESDLKYTDVMTVGGWQDGAICDGKLFVLAGSGAVYDLAAQTKLGSFTLDKADVIKPHANSVCFGSTYYAEGDKYPLLYANVYNNYASSADRMEGTCCVYRLMETDGNFTTELVQVIRIGFTEDLTLWKSKENNGDVRPYGNFVVDIDNGKLYAFVMRDADKQTRFFRFDLPALTAGTYSEAYGCNVVTLEAADIEAQFDTEYFSYTQGCCYWDGKIISVEGFNSGSAAEPALRIVDLAAQKVEKTYYTAEAGLTKEPEVVCVDPADNGLYYAAADGMLRKLMLPEMDAVKTISILGDSISTFTGVSNDASVNATLSGGAIYYSPGTLGVYRADTWWQQTIDALGLELLVNNSWSGSCILPTRSGAAGAYLDRCVQLHNDTTGEEPDMIAVFLGTNDFSYYQNTLGTADIDYDTLITDNGDGTFSYGEPATSCEAYAIMLHKMTTRYPEAEIYCMTPTARRDPDKADSYADVGQPTAFNRELAGIIEHFGCTVVDLEACGIDKAAAVFDQYMGDGRVHPNAEGMDLITQAVVNAMLGEETAVYEVSAGLSNVTMDNGSHAVLGGGAYRAELTAAEGFGELTVAVTMGGADITESCYGDGVIAIEHVTGDIVVTASAAVVKEPESYRWEFDGTDLVSVGETENTLTKLAGTTTEGVLGGTRYQLEKSIVLRHDLPWEVEWKCAGDWSGMLLTSTEKSGTTGMSFLFRTYNATQLVAFGEYTGSGYNNYGIPLAELDTGEHTYRIENRIAADGSNMAYLLVDGTELGAMNNYYIGGTNDQKKTVDWTNGRDFVFGYMGSTSHPLNNMAPEYVAVWENGEPDEQKTISILGASISTYAGTSNGAAADTTNSTIRNNVKYYPNTTIPEVALDDTWWMQVCEDLNLRLLVNNSWSGSSLLHTRSGTVGAYVDRCVQLHDNTGDNAGEEPDIIAIQLGTNDFQYYKDTLGTADIDYDTLIADNGDGTYAYAEPVTSLEAAAIVLHRISIRYPDAEVYYLNISQRVDGTDELIRSFNAELAKVCAHFGVTIVDIYDSAITMEDFDTYIGDGRVHPNKLGMDAYTEAFVKAYNANHAKPSEAADYSGKVISILGDSISTFAGYIPTADGFNLEHDSRYPQDNLLTDVNETWWMQVINELDAKLGINDSWRSTEVYNYIDEEVNSTYDGTKACMASTTRIQNLGSNGTPDVILFYGGTNDINQSRPLGSFDPAAAPTEVDLTSEKWDTVADAYVTAVMRLQHFYPEAEIVAMLPTYTSGRYSAETLAEYNAVFAAICEHYGVTYVDLRYCGISTDDLPDGIHPDANGMDCITNAVLETLLTECEMEPGENVVYPVTHELTDAEASRHYYKGVSAGRTFTETLTGENLDVTVTMGGADITEGCYAGGVITIENVTGELVITAKARFSLGEHLQQLPETFCAGVNLWTELEPQNDYYTANGWGNLSGSQIYSVTIPVEPGDRLWATSFGAYGANGNDYNTTSGIRATFFDENGVCKAMTPAETYAEFRQNGYLTVPEGAVAVNVPMWSNADSNELYILNAEHQYSGKTCTICGGANPNVSEVPENPLSTAWPSLNTDLTHIICYGQSFSNGSDAPGYADPIVEGTYVLGSITGSKTGDALKPLQMTSGTQHPIVSAVNSLSQMLTAAGIETDIIAGSYGTGGRTIAQLMSGERQAQIKAEEGYTYDCASSGKYEVFQSSVAAVADYAAENGQSVSCPVIVYLQGETDQNTDEQLGYPDNPIRAGYGAGGDKEKYKEYMTRLKEDMQREVMEAYGQTEKPLFLIYQVSGTYVRTPESSINMAQIEFAQENEDVILIQTPYFTPHYTVSHHLTVNGYRWLGEYIAQDMYEALVERTKPWPMLPVSLECTSDTTISIRVSGAENGLSIDTYTVEDASNGRNKYGFAVFVDGTRVVPEAVTVSGNEILLTLPESTVLSTAASVSVQYGGQSASGTGNIRDNSTAKGFYAYLDDSGDTGVNGNQGVSYSALDVNGNSLVGQKYPLYNWLASFYYDVKTDSLHKHSYTVTVVAPTCTGQGYTAYTCACGEAYADTFVDAIGMHAYEAVVTAPTCTEKGYTTHTCTVCGDSYVDSETEATGHSYVGTVCTLCGAEHPNTANYEGKVISILSASTSTFEGYIPVADGFNLEHRARYPQENLLTDVNETWWMQVINELDAKLGINDSWAGSQVLNTIDGNSGDLGENAAMASLTRIQNLGSNGTPDVILFFGGGNDTGRGVPLGSFDPAAAPTEVDLTATKWDTFADAYVAAILRLQHFYPDSQIVVMLYYEMPSYVTEAKLDQYGTVIKAICEHYGVPYVELRDCGMTFDMLPDGVHPNAEGMDLITAAVRNKLLNDVEMEAGENQVFAVTHQLTNASASLGYYKGVSAGKTFTETLTGDALTVTVTMGGEDITQSCYANGVVTIPAVTGDLVITAKAAFTAGGHLQQLPERFCAGTNLWTALEPENVYYTANGWGNTAAGTSWSVTFSVEAGERIWATSFGAYPDNGSSANGVRVTWFEENGVLETVSRDVVYAEFAANGYLTAPEGTVAVNVPMTNNQADYAVYILNAEHSYESVVTAPTCTEQGYTTHTCAICGDSYVDAHVDAAGHSEVVDKAVEATCTESGLTKGKHCSVCKAVLVKQKVVPAEGHRYEAGACAVCGAEDPDWVEPTEPTEPESTEPEETEPEVTEPEETEPEETEPEETEPEETEPEETEPEETEPEATEPEETEPEETEPEATEPEETETEETEPEETEPEETEPEVTEPEATEPEGTEPEETEPEETEPEETEPEETEPEETEPEETEPEETEPEETEPEGTEPEATEPEETEPEETEPEATEPEETEPEVTEPEPTEPEPTEPDESGIVRIAGENRFETAFLVADQMKENLGVEKFEAIIVASGSNFADALSGSYLAAVKNAPILLSFDEEYNEKAKDYIWENLAPGGTVYILGGPAAVPKSMEEGLDNFNIIRLAGDDRFGTNLAILEEAGVEDKDILVCTGVEFADSLSASASERPILLVWKELTEEQKTFLAGLNGNKLYIIGGEAAVSGEMEKQVSDYGETERIGGKNRFETSVLIAEEFFEEPDSAVLAYAWNYPDGLCGGALASTMDAPLILTMTDYEIQATEYVQKIGISKGTILGGTGLIADTAVRMIFGTDVEILLK